MGSGFILRWTITAALFGVAISVILGPPTPAADPGAMHQNEVRHLDLPSYAVGPRFHRAKLFYTTAPWPGSQPLWVCWKYLKMLGNVPAFAGVPMPGKFA